MIFILEPSYIQIANKLNANDEQNISSRYSLIIASAQRARQIIDEETNNRKKAFDEYKVTVGNSLISKPFIYKDKVDKPLSKAVNEIYDGKIKISETQKK